MQNFLSFNLTGNIVISTVKHLNKIFGFDRKPNVGNKKNKIGSNKKSEHLLSYFF